MKKKKSIYPKPVSVRNPDPKSYDKTPNQQFVIMADKLFRGARLLKVIPRKGKPDLIKNLYNITENRKHLK